MKSKQFSEQLTMNSFPEHLQEQKTIENVKEFVHSSFKGRLINVNEPELENANITSFSKSILCNIGLPRIDRSIVDLISIDINLAGQKLPILGELLDCSPVPSKLQIFNNCACIDLSNGIITFISFEDTVYKLQQNCKNELYFINSNMQSFLLFVAIFTRHWNHTKDMPIEKRVVLDERLGHLFGRIDPVAMADHDNWWPTIIDDMLNLQI
jgi:hypothetical protein